MKYYIQLLIITLLLGCAQKTQIKAIQSSQISDNCVRHIGVAPFKSDKVSQSSQIESALNDVIIDDNKYFKIVDRKNIDRVMNEKRLNDSGLVDLLKDNSSVGLSQMQTLLTGKVILDEMSSSRYYAQRTDYNRCIKSYTKNGKTYCSRYGIYNVSCMRNLYTLKTYIKLIKISDGTALFSNTYSNSSEYRHCEDDSGTLPSKRHANTIQAKLIAQKLIKDIAPSYVYYEVELLDKPDIDLNDKEENIFENALKMIELKRVQKANKMLQTLNHQTNSRSYVILYDLAITYETLGNVNKSMALLELAEDIALSSDGIIEEITTSIKRVSKSIKEQNRAKKQF